MGNCADCKNYDIYDARGIDEFRCRYFYDFYVPSESCSGHYEYDPLKRDEVAKMIKKRRSFYITSAVCEILGLNQDEYGYMRAFALIECIVMKTNKADTIKQYYDADGLFIRNQLLSLDKNKAKVMALYITTKYMRWVKKSVDGGDIALAVNIYYIMCQDLKLKLTNNFVYTNNDFSRVLAK